MRKLRDFVINNHLLKFREWYCRRWNQICLILNLLLLTSITFILIILNDWILPVYTCAYMFLFVCMWVCQRNTTVKICVGWEEKEKDTETQLKSGNVITCIDHCLLSSVQGREDASLAQLGNLCSPAAVNLCGVVLLSLLIWLGSTQHHLTTSECLVRLNQASCYHHFYDPWPSSFCFENSHSLDSLSYFMPQSQAFTGRPSVPG